MKKFILFIILITSLLAVSQNPIASNRKIDWTTDVGLPATLPDGETTTNAWTPPTGRTACTTITPTSAGDIRTAVINCSSTYPNGSIVTISGSGSVSSPTVYNFGFCMASNAYPNAVNNVTIQGNGVKFVLPASSSVSLGGCATQFSATYQVTTAGAIPAGTTSLTLSSVANITAGRTILAISQCSTGFGGSGCTNSSGAQVDTGTNPLWVCGGDNPWCSHGGTGNGGTADQIQMVLVTSVVGNTVNFTPGLYLNNWNSSNYPQVTFLYPPATGLGLEGVGNGGITIDGTSTGSSTTALWMQYCYSCWVTGVRLVNGRFGISGSMRSLVANTYAGDWLSHNLYGITESNYGFGNNLILNNITDGYDSVASDQGGSADIWAYNFNTFSAFFFTHVGGTAFMGIEGNVGSQYTDDNIHGTHLFSTVLRNRLSACCKQEGAGAVMVGQGTRFNNVLGNVLGNGNQSVYENPFGSTNGGIYGVGIGAVKNIQGSPFDQLAHDTLFRWGNYDTLHAAWQWNNSEVPSALNDAVGYQQQIGTGDGVTKTFTGTLSNLPCIIGMGWIYDAVDKYYAFDDGAGNYSGGSGYNANYGTNNGTVNCTTGAVSITFGTAPALNSPVWVNYLVQTASANAFRNAVPANHDIPDSLFIPLTGYYPTGGTGLSWWKVCTNFPTCNTFSTPAFPPIGTDVSGGTETAGSYKIPAQLAIDSLPIDTSYQTTYSITGTTVTGTGPYTVKVTVSGTPIFIPMGRFTISGVTPSSYNGTYYMTTQTSNSVTYSSVSNPGAYTSGGTVAYPQVPLFAPSVYTTDPASASPVASVAPTSLAFGNQTQNTTSSALTSTLTNIGTATLTVSSIALTTGTQFAESNNCGVTPFTLAAGASCTISVTFTPLGIASYSDTVTVTSNGGNPTIALSGTGVGNSPPSATLAASPVAGSQNSSITLSWTTSNATSVSLDNGIGNVSPVSSGSVNVSISWCGKKTFTLTATGGGGSVQKTVDVYGGCSGSNGTSGTQGASGSSIPK